MVFACPFAGILLALKKLLVVGGSQPVRIVYLDGIQTGHVEYAFVNDSPRWTRKSRFGV